MIEWTPEWSRRLNIMDVQTLLAHDCYVRGVSIRKSTIKSEIAGKGLFAEKNFVKGDVLSYYYGALVYGEIGRKKKNLQRRYGEGVLAVAAKTLNKQSIEVHYEFVDTSGERHSAWIALAPFCCSRFINDPRYHDTDKADEEERKKNPRKSNVSFNTDKKAKLNRDFERVDVIQVTATAAIPKGAEIFSDYGINYVFEQ